jgi:hypothetical protein
LTDLLRCANQKLVWEKNVASLQKRTPLLLEKMTALMDDPKNPPAEQTRTEIVRVLKGVQAAVERLSQASGSGGKEPGEGSSSADPSVSQRS